jgi:hypothetical protein
LPAAVDEVTARTTSIFTPKKKEENYYDHHPCLEDHIISTSEGHDDKDNKKNCTTKNGRVTSVTVGRQSFVSVLGMDESHGSIGHDDENTKILPIVQSISDGCRHGQVARSSRSGKDNLEYATTLSSKRMEGDDDHIVTQFTDEIADSSPTVRQEHEKARGTCNLQSDDFPHDQNANKYVTPLLEQSYESNMDPTTTTSPSHTTKLRQISERSFESGSILSMASTSSSNNNKHAARS